MNERIKELAEEAGIDAWWDSGDETREVLQEHLEKFADLIIKECALLIAEELETRIKLPDLKCAASVAGSILQAR